MSNLILILVVAVFGGTCLAEINPSTKPKMPSGAVQTTVVTPTAVQTTVVTPVPPVPTNTPEISSCNASCDTNANCPAACPTCRPSGFFWLFTSCNP